MSRKSVPCKIVCMTEESVEVLYALGLQDHIIGVSAFVERPIEAKSKPTLSTFTHANLSRILDAKPDLVLGFSDIQKDIARDLIGEGLNVFISNHRSIDEMLDYVIQLGSLMGQRQKAMGYIERLEQKREQALKLALSFNYRPKVYFEEWDEPRITGIKWVSELIELCGGDDIFKHQSQGVLAKDRFVTSEEIVRLNPDIMFACHCGKKVDILKIIKGKELAATKAIQDKRVYELAPAIFLQPGPAILEDGIDILQSFFAKFQ